MRLLESVLSANSFCEVNQLEYSQGSGDSIYFRLTQEKSAKCEECGKMRWLPSNSATMQFTFDDIDSNAKITRTGTMAFPSDDRSVWKVDMMPNDKITGFVSATLTDGGKTTTILLDGKLNIISVDGQRFFC
jgi:hypothetical protein